MAWDQLPRLLGARQPFELGLGQVAELGYNADAGPQSHRGPDHEGHSQEIDQGHGDARATQDAAQGALPALAGTESGGELVAAQGPADDEGGRIGGEGGQNSKHQPFGALVALAQEHGPGQWQPQIEGARRRESPAVESGPRAVPGQSRDERHQGAAAHDGTHRPTAVGYGEADKRQRPDDAHPWQRAGPGGRNELVELPDADNGDQENHPGHPGDSSPDD